MKGKLFKTSLFGFSKIEVCDYIVRISDEFNGKIDLLIAEHIEAKKELLAQIATLNEEINKYKQANVDINQTFFDTEQYATELNDKTDYEYDKVQDKLSAYKKNDSDKLNVYCEKNGKEKKDIISLHSDIDDVLTVQKGKTEDLIAEYYSEEGIAV